jgi:hypothetical protein
MARIVGSHICELKPGVAAEDFERFLRDEWKPSPMPGCKACFSKAVRHDREGAYALFMEFDSVETWQRYFPVPGPEGSDEWRRVSSMISGTPGQNELDAKQKSMVGHTGAATDWQVLSE